MNILYVGDIMATPGIELVEQLLPGLRAEYQVDVVLAQAENVSDGKGITPADMSRLQAAGVDAFTAGNHSLARSEINAAMNDPDQPIIRPANYPVGTPGLGYKYIQTPRGKLLFISLLGQIVGRDSDKPVDNPLQVIDKILADETDVDKIATVVNFHGDFSSEKV
ncbi:MAG: YmdB family metallophosphoesterase, partial [Candidatus Saccharimonadales bacterium]